MRSVGARPGGVEETARQQDGEGDHDQRQADAQDIAGDMGGSPAPRLLPRDMGDDAAVFLFLVHRNLSFPWRSEEHTSELQSLMRISYAVFCLKKKNNNT